MDQIEEIHSSLTVKVTTKFSNNQETLVPALGQSWSHIATNRVMLYWEGK